MHVSMETMLHYFRYFGMLAAIFMALLSPAVTFFLPILILFIILWHINLSNYRSSFLLVIRSVCKLE